MRPFPIVAWLLALAAPAGASTFDNEAGRYVLTALPDAGSEAERMDRMLLCDQQPAGRQVRKGERVVVTAGALPPGFELSALVGFRPMWGDAQDQQEVALDTGTTGFRADQDGPLYFRFTTPDGALDADVELAVSVVGGQPLPLYVDGRMSAQAWARELAAHADAAFVQLIGTHALVTLPMDVYAADPIADPRASFAAIDDVLRLEDDLSGFDGSDAANRPTPLRVHYLVDFRASEKDREGFYMYATDEFVGMLADNTGDLTDPARLRREWGIWHETGHTQQQNSWTWDALAEINVNLYSLYVQETFGQPSTLALSEDGAPSFLDRARDYLENGADNLLVDDPDDDSGDSFFIRLVLFHQLVEVYGWDLFRDLNRHFRAHPLDADASDQDKADALVGALCELTGVDLRPFFRRWGLTVSTRASRRIAAERYPLPDRDYSQIFD